MNIKKEFEQTVVVKQNEGDLNGRLKMSALLRYVQQISTDHCNELGVTDEDYSRTHSAFLLAKTSVEVYENIKVGETLRLLTHPGNSVKAVYPRYTEIFNEQNRLVASVDARWILLDTENRKIYRKKPQDLSLEFENETVPMHEDLSIPKEKEAELVGEETVRYSRLDVNHHLNNTEYADIVCDYLPAELVCEKAIKKMVVHYHKEVKLGETLAITRKERDEDWYVCGSLADKKSFEALVRFA